MDHLAAPGRARARHVRGLDARGRARGAHDDDPHRPPRHLRPVPPSGGARQDGRDRRRALRRPARARDRVGIGRAASSRPTASAPARRGARGAAARDARDPRPDVRRASRSTTTASTTSCAARSAGRGRCSCRGRRCTSAAPGRSSRCRSCATTPTGGTARRYAVDRLAELRPLAGDARVSVQHPVGLARRRRRRATTSSRPAQRRFGSWGGADRRAPPTEVADALAAEVAARRRGLRAPVHRLRPARDRSSTSWPRSPRPSTPDRPERLATPGREPVRRPVEVRCAGKPRSGPRRRAGRPSGS